MPPAASFGVALACSLSSSCTLSWGGNYFWSSSAILGVCSVFIPFHPVCAPPPLLHVLGHFSLVSCSPSPWFRVPSHSSVPASPSCSNSSRSVYWAMAVVRLVQSQGRSPRILACPRLVCWLTSPLLRSPQLYCAAVTAMADVRALRQLLAALPWSPAAPGHCHG